MFPFVDELHGKYGSLQERVWFRRDSDGLLQIKYRRAYDHRESCVKTLTGTLINIILFTNQAVDTFFPGTHYCVDKVLVRDVNLGSEEEEFEDEEEGENEEVDENMILEDEVIQFEDIKKARTEAPRLIAESTEMQLLASRYNDHKNKLREKSRAANFWLQYLDYTNIFKIFIRV